MPLTRSLAVWTVQQVSVRCLPPKSNSKPRWPLMPLRRTSNLRSNRSSFPFPPSSLPSQGPLQCHRLKLRTSTQPSTKHFHILKTSSFKWLCKHQCRPPTWVRLKATPVTKTMAPTQMTSEKARALNYFKPSINTLLILIQSDLFW